MFRYFSYILIALFVFPACKVTQVSVPDAWNPEVKQSENNQSASAALKPPSAICEPSGLSGNRSCFTVYDTSVSTNQPWIENMIFNTGVLHDRSLNVYTNGVYTAETNNYTGPCVLVESESSMRWLSEARSITYTQEQPETANEKKIPVITWIGFVFSILPVVSVIGVVLSIISIYKIEKYPELYRGENLAGISLLFGLLWALLGVMFLLTFSMPLM